MDFIIMNLMGILFDAITRSCILWQDLLASNHSIQSREFEIPAVEAISLLKLHAQIPKFDFLTPSPTPSLNGIYNAKLYRSAIIVYIVQVTCSLVRQVVRTGEDGTMACGRN